MVEQTGQGWRVRTALYWVVAVACIAFGLLASPSTIGAPFVVTGVAMMALWPIRRRVRVFWPALVGVIAFSAVLLLVAPSAGCERTGILSPAGVEEEEHSTCSSLIGIHYSGAGEYEPSVLPAALAGLGVGAAAAAGTYVIVRRRGATSDAETPSVPTAV
jgi:hypothetical protein